MSLIERETDCCRHEVYLLDLNQDFENTKSNRVEFTKTNCVKVPQVRHIEPTYALELSKHNKLLSFFFPCFFFLLFFDPLCSVLVCNIIHIYGIFYSELS